MSKRARPFRSVIVGTGHYIPNNIVSSQDLVAENQFYDREGKPVTVDLVKLKKTIGINYRPTTSESVVDMGAKALEDLIEHTRIEPDDISHVLVASNTGDKISNVGSQISRKVGLQHAWSPEMVYGCQGFCGMLNSGDSEIVAGKVKRNKYVAVVATENLTSVKDKTVSSLLFADGAAAVLLKPLQTNERTGIIKSYWIADNSSCDAITMKDNKAPEGARRVMTMDGEEVFKQADKVFHNAYYGLLGATRLKDDQIRLHLLHQASWKIFFYQARRIFERENPELRKKFPIDRDFDPFVMEYIMKKMPYTVDFLGNSSIVTTPTMLSIIANPPKEFNPLLEPMMQRMKNYSIRPNDLIVINAAGAGMAGMAILFKWHELYLQMRK